MKGVATNPVHTKNSNLISHISQVKLSEANQFYEYSQDYENLERMIQVGGHEYPSDNE